MRLSYITCYRDIPYQDIQEFIGSNLDFGGCTLVTSNHDYPAMRVEGSQIADFVLSPDEKKKLSGRGVAMEQAELNNCLVKSFVFKKDELADSCGTYAEYRIASELRGLKPLSKELFTIYKAEI